MKSRIGGVISGTAIALSVVVGAFGLAATANAESSSMGGSKTQVVLHGDKGRPDLDALAEVLGVSTSELKTQLQSGKTLAEIAAAQSVEVAKVIDTIVDDMKTKLAAKVASGEITQSEADAKLADITERVTEMVNNGRPAGAMRFRGNGHRGIHTTEQGSDV